MRSVRACVRACVRVRSVVFSRRPLADRLGRRLARKELMPLIVALFENVCHLDWDSPVKAEDVVAQDLADSAGTNENTSVCDGGGGGRAATEAVGDDDFASSEEDEGAEEEDDDDDDDDEDGGGGPGGGGSHRSTSPPLPTDEESQAQARESRQKLLLALMHTDMQLLFCQAFGPLEYVRVIFPYLEDSLYIFPSVAPSSLSAVAAAADAAVAAAASRAPRDVGVSTVMSLRGRTRSMRGGRGVYKGGDAGQEHNLQYVVAGWLVGWLVWLVGWLVGCCAGCDASARIHGTIA